MGFLASIFGGGQDEPAPAPVAAPIEEPEEQVTRVDKGRDEELSEAAKQKKAILARRGRSSLVTSRQANTTTGGVSILGS